MDSSTQGGHPTIPSCPRRRASILTTPGFPIGVGNDGGRASQNDPAPLPIPTAIAYTRPMSTNNDHNARHDRLEDAILSMEATQRRLEAAALKHDVMLEMLQALQRDQAIDVQRHEEMLNQIVALLQQQNLMMHKVIDTQQAQAEVQRDQAQVQRDHASAIQKHDETQEAMRVAIQTLSTILRRLTENGNDPAR